MENETNVTAVKNKLWFAVAAVALILISIALVSIISFSNTQQKLAKVTQQYQPKMLSAMQLTTHFYHSLSVLGNYMVEQDEYNIVLYSDKVNDIDSTLDELIELTEKNNEPQDATQLELIRTLVNEIKSYNRDMLKLAADVKRNMPAVGIAADWMEPQGVEMTHLLSDIKAEAKISSQYEFARSLDNLLYNWAMVISQVRSYLAFRNDAAVDDIYLYLEGVKQHRNEVGAYLKTHQPELLELVEEFNDGLTNYESYLTQVIDVHGSSQWRADSSLMREQITPTLRKLTLELDELVTTQKLRIDKSNQELSAQIATAEKTIRISMIVALIVTLVVFLLIIRTRGLMSLVKLQQLQKAKIQHAAQHDSLTGIPNRAYFNERLLEIVASRRGVRRFSLLFIDLDGFKKINDTVGHDAGDFILVETAKRLEKIVRKSDMVARVGGDEFILVLDDVESNERAELVAGKVCASLKEIFNYKGEELQIGCSIGVLVMDSMEISTPVVDEENLITSIVKRADEAMYQAKRSGKNRYCVYKGPQLRIA